MYSYVFHSRCTAIAADTWGDSIFKYIYRKAALKQVYCLLSGTPRQRQAGIGCHQLQEPSQGKDAQAWWYLLHLWWFVKSFSQTNLQKFVSPKGFGCSSADALSCPALQLCTWHPFAPWCFSYHRTAISSQPPHVFVTSLTFHHRALLWGALPARKNMEELQWWSKENIWLYARYGQIVSL